MIRHLMEDLEEILMDLKNRTPDFGKFKKTLLTTLSVAALSFTAVSNAAVWSESSVSALRGWNFYEINGSATDWEKESKWIFTYENALAWDYGDSFFFADVGNAFRSPGKSDQERDRTPDLYLEWSPRLSLGKMTGSAMSFGPIKDISVAGQLNYAEGVNFDRAFQGAAYLAGGGADWDIPGFAYFNTNVYAKFTTDNSGESKTVPQVTVSWLLPFEFGQMKWSFGGFLDWVTNNYGDAKKSVLSQPQLLLDVGNFMGKPNVLFAGMEFEYWYNKFGADLSDGGTKDQFAYSAMVKWVL